LQLLVGWNWLSAVKYATGNENFRVHMSDFRPPFSRMGNFIYLCIFVGMSFSVGNTQPATKISASIDGTLEFTSLRTPCVKLRRTSVHLYGYQAVLGAIQYIVRTSVIFSNYNNEFYTQSVWFSLYHVFLSSSQHFAKS